VYVVTSLLYSSNLRLLINRETISYHNICSDTLHSWNRSRPHRTAPKHLDCKTLRSYIIKLSKQNLTGLHCRPCLEKTCPVGWLHGNYPHLTEFVQRKSDRHEVASSVY
jgi:hypothetical protein